MTENNKPSDKDGSLQPAQDQGAFGALTTSGELDVVKGEPPAPQENNEESE